MPAARTRTRHRPRCEARTARGNDEACPDSGPSAPRGGTQRSFCAAVVFDVARRVRRGGRESLGVGYRWCRGGVNPRGRANANPGESCVLPRCGVTARRRRRVAFICCHVLVFRKLRDEGRFFLGGPEEAAARGVAPPTAWSPEISATLALGWSGDTSTARIRSRCSRWLCQAMAPPSPRAGRRPTSPASRISGYGGSGMTS